MTNTVKKGDVSLANKLRIMLLYVATQSGLKALLFAVFFLFVYLIFPSRSG